MSVLIRVEIEFVQQEELTKLMVYEKLGVNDLKFAGEICCNTHPSTPASYLDNGLFIVSDASQMGALSIVTGEEKHRLHPMGVPPPWNPKKYNTA